MVPNIFFYFLFIFFSPLFVCHFLVMHNLIKAYNFLEVKKFTNCQLKGHFAKRAN